MRCCPPHIACRCRERGLTNFPISCARGLRSCCWGPRQEPVRRNSASIMPIQGTSSGARFTKSGCAAADGTEPIFCAARLRHRRNRSLQDASGRQSSDPRLRCRKFCAEDAPVSSARGGFHQQEGRENAARLLHRRHRWREAPHRERGCPCCFRSAAAIGQGCRLWGHRTLARLGTLAESGESLIASPRISRAVLCANFAMRGGSDTDFPWHPSMVATMGCRPAAF
jgi:hypothetical protein